VELSEGTGSQPIVVRWLWNDCDLLRGGQGFVVEIRAGRVSGLLGAQSHDRQEAMESVVACAARLPRDRDAGEFIVANCDIFDHVDT
jgi:hypothetical protein